LTGQSWRMKALHTCPKGMYGQARTCTHRVKFLTAALTEMRILGDANMFATTVQQQRTAGRHLTSKHCVRDSTN